MHFLITGGSGFIGSNLIPRLLEDSHHVSVFDVKPLEACSRLQSFLDQIEYQQIDFQNLSQIKSQLRNFDTVIHLFGRANTRVGSSTDLDLNQGPIAPYNILEAMKINQIPKIIFSSGPGVYGNPKQFPTNEETGPFLPVSLYGAAKLASEGLISAYCNLFNIQSWIFRFGNVVGNGMTRGVIFDLISKLKRDPKNLEILGNGKQKKDLIFIDDCISGILTAFHNSNERVNLFNLSSGTTLTVNDIVDIIIDTMKLKNVEITHTGGKTGWVGDVSKIHLDASKLRNLGWKPRFSCEESVRLTTKEILKSL